MKRFSKVSFDDIKTIQVDSGVLLKEFDVENPVFLPENVICATSGGINPVCAPEYYDFGEDVDNAKAAKETKRIRGWNVSISFTTFTTSLDLIRLALGAADISGKVLSIRQKLQYAKDFKDIWWVGKRADDKLLAIRLIRSLSDSGFSLQTNKRGKGQISVTLKGHCSFSDIKKVPMEIYVLAEVPTASLYLYGTPSTTGNIGLRNGESVTYYDGAVLPNIDTVYTDELKKTHPYAGIITANGDYMLIVTDAKAVQYTGIWPNCAWDTEDGKCAFESWVYYAGTSDAWEVSTSSEHGSPTAGFSCEWKWANHGVHDGSGNLYLAQSEPIPVSGVVDTINNIPIYEDLR